MAIITYNFITLVRLVPTAPTAHTGAALAAEASEGIASEVEFKLISINWRNDWNRSEGVQYSTQSCFKEVSLHTNKMGNHWAFLQIKVWGLQG